jgi:hypothetical protein
MAVISCQRRRVLNLTPVEAGPEFQRVWPWLRQYYGQLEEALRPFWQQTKAGGKPTQADRETGQTGYSESTSTGRRRWKSVASW